MKPINSSKHLRPITRLCSDHATMNAVRLRIQRDCNNHKPVTRNLDPAAVERRRKIDDIEDAKSMGMTLAEYRLMMGIV